MSWQKSTLLLITFGNIVQMLLFMYFLIPAAGRLWRCLICHFHKCACQPYWSNTKLFFRYSSFEIRPILPKIGRDDLWTEPHRNDWTEFFVLGVKKKLWCCEVNRAQPKIDSGTVSRPNVDQSIQNLISFISMMRWRYTPKLGTAPPMDRDVAKINHYLLAF